MSRLLSFLKKKDKDAGVDYTGSPPPSPKADNDQKDAKSVKQIKKKHHRRDKRKAPLPQPGGVATPILESGVDVHVSLGHSLIDDAIDANGNSMTGKGKAAALDNGDLTAALNSKSTEGEADSLRDVDSICEDETANGFVCAKIDTTVVSAEPYLVGGTNPDLEEAGPAENGTEEEDSLAQIPLPVASEGCSASVGRELKYVSSFSDSGENILIDDIMDEALDDLEDDLDDDDRDGLNGTVESSDTTDKEESSVRLATPVNSYPEADSLNVESNSKLPCENGSLLESSINSHDGADMSHLSTSVCGGRFLSTDTVGTGYSSCDPGSDPGSDHFESAFEELPPFTKGGEQLDVVVAVDGCVFNDTVGDNDGTFEVSLRPKNTSCDNPELNASAEFTNADLGKLEVCFEVESKGRASAIAQDIIEARNCLLATDDGDRLGTVKVVDQAKVHDELSDGLEESLASATRRPSDDTSNKEEVASPQKFTVEENERAIGKIETQVQSSICAKEPKNRLHSSDCTELQSESCEVSPSDPSIVSDTIDVLGRPESVGAVVDSNPESSQTLGDSPVSVYDTCNVTENSDTNLVNGEEEREGAEPTLPVNSSKNHTDVLDTVCEERPCDDINGVIPEEKEKSSGEPDADSTAAVSDDSEMPPASAPAGNSAGDVGKRDETGAENTKPDCEGHTEPALHEPSPERTSGSDASEIGSEQAAIELPLSLNVTASSKASERSPEQSVIEPPFTPDVSSSSDTPNTPTGSSRKSSRPLKPQASLEDELEKHGAIIEDQAEAQLAQRRAARAEARELRLKELERQQQQNPENADDASDMSDGGSGGRLAGRSSASRPSAPSTVPPPPPPPHYSRRSSEESTNEEPACKDVRELEEKFRVAMINNASLDNDKTRLTFQIEELKDCRTDLTEQLTQIKKEHKKKCSEHEQLRKVYAKLQEDSRAVRRVLEERDELIQEYGLVVVGGGDEDDVDDDEENEALAAREETEDGLVLPRPVPMKRVLLTQEAAEILQQGAAKGSLEWRLRRVVERKRELEDELRRVNLELAEQVNTQRQSNCIDSNIQKEANKTVSEYKFRVQKAEAEVSSLQANVNRLEALVTRYKTQTEELERSEEELKAEKRRLQRERREIQEKCDELETSKNYIKRQYEKLLHDRQGARH